jgi:hypothetical protein
MVVAANMTRRDIGHIIYQNDENFLIYNLPSLEEFYIIPIDLTSILLSASQLGFLFFIVTFGARQNRDKTRRRAAAS